MVPRELISLRPPGPLTGAVLDRIIDGAPKGVEASVTISVPLTTRPPSTSATTKSGGVGLRQEWLTLPCDRTLDPYRAYHIDIHWLVCSAKYEHRRALCACVLCVSVAVCPCAVLSPAPPLLPSPSNFFPLPPSAWPQERA